MGTRHLTMIYANGAYRVSQYGQWDGYPDGQGLTILTSLRGLDLSTLRERALAVIPLTKEEMESDWEDYKKLFGDTVESSDLYFKKYPERSRDMGGDIVAFVGTQPAPVRLKINVAFAADSLFCEWAYVIDCDRNTFEVFKGFNKTPLDQSERFASLPLQPDHGEYYQVKHVASWPLQNLPSDSDFLQAFKTDE